MPFSEERQVTLSPDEFLNKTHVMLRVSREKENLEAESDHSKATYKQRIKEKQEEITELNGELQSNSEKRVVPLIARFFPKTRVKVVLDAATKKKIKTEPMTNDEVRRCEKEQTPLIDVPVTTAPTATAPVNQPTHPDGQTPVDPERTNPTNIEEVKFVGEGEHGESGV